MATATITRSVLAAALARLDKGVLHRSPREITQCLYLSINGEFVLACNDLESIGIESVSSVQKNGEASTCVNAKQLRKIVTTSKEKELEVSIDDGKITVAGATLQGQDCKEFPSVSIPAESSAKQTVWIEGKRLANMLDYCSLACDVDSTRSALIGCSIEMLEGDNLRVVGTDGYRLHVAETGEFTSQESAILHQSHCERLSSAARKCDRVELRIHENRIVAICYLRGEIVTSLVFRAIECRYPAWRQVVPSESDYRITIRGDLLQLAAERIANFHGRKSEVPHAIVSVKNGSDIQMTGKKDTGDNMIQTVPVAYGSGDRDSISLQLNAFYLADAVPAGADLVCFSGVYRKHCTPVKIETTIGAVRFVGLVMPCLK